MSLVSGIQRPLPSYSGAASTASSLKRATYSVPFVSSDMLWRLARSVRRGSNFSAETNL